MPIDNEVINQALAIMETEPIGIKPIAKRLSVDTADLHRALNSTQELSQRYADAKEKQIEIKIASMDDSIAELLLTIKDKNVDGKTKNALVSAVKLKIDTDKWIASKLKPKKYGERLELSGTVEHKHSARPASLSALSADDLKALIAIQGRATGALPGPQPKSIERDKAQEVKPLSVLEISTRNDDGENWLI